MSDKTPGTSVPLTSFLVETLDGDNQRLFSNLQGQILTLVDASFSDLAQRKAFKDLVSQMFWDSMSRSTMQIRTEMSLLWLALHQNADAAGMGETYPNWFDRNVTSTDPTQPHMPNPMLDPTLVNLRA